MWRSKASPGHPRIDGGRAQRTRPATWFGGQGQLSTLHLAPACTGDMVREINRQGVKFIAKRKSWYSYSNVDFAWERYWGGNGSREIRYVRYCLPFPSISSMYTREAFCLGRKCEDGVNSGRNSRHVWKQSFAAYHTTGKRHSREMKPAMNNCLALPLLTCVCIIMLSIITACRHILTPPSECGRVPYMGMQMMNHYHHKIHADTNGVV